MNNANWLKTISIGLAIISFGITLAIIGYIVLTTRQNQPTNQQPTTSSPTTPQPSPTPSDETANWETYRNEEIGFEVKYPAESFVSAEEQSKNSIEILFNGGYSLRVTVTPTETKTVRELSWLNSKQTTLGPYEALESLPDTPPFNSRTYTLINEEKLYQLYGQNYGEGEKERLDQILSTFKFTSP